VDAADLVFAGVARQAEWLRAGEASSPELVEACIARIEALDPRLNAFRVVLGERARLEARQAQERLGAGDRRPLLGVPVAVKDSVDLAGEVTAAGTRAHGPPAAGDAELVRRLRGAGAIVIGKTHLPELALWPFTESATYGATRNPWDPERSAGGSSGGSAVAVAAGMVGGAQGSDGGGSIRVPAAACGLFGLKTDRGRISLQPVADHWHGLSVAGPLARHVADAALLLDAMSGSAPSDPVPAPTPARSFAEAAGRVPPRLRVAVSLRAPLPVRVDREVRHAVEETAEVLRAAGHAVGERDPAYGAIGSSFVPRYLRGAHDEAATLPHPERLERRTRRVARLGGLLSPSLVRRARAAEAAHAARVGELFRDHDVLLTATVPSPAPPLGRYEGRGALATMAGVSAQEVAFTTPWNTLGQPAASVPAGMSSGGLPLAVQLVGRRGEEATLLALAAQLEAERPWADRRPPLA
jgi:amidase